MPTCWATEASAGTVSPPGGAERPSFWIETRFAVLHEDEDLLVIDKPAPLAVHPVGCYTENNLHALLLRDDPRRAACGVRFVHRLDAETSGVLVAAKSHEAARSLGIQFLRREVRKIYRALVYGCPDPREREIAWPLGASPEEEFPTVRVVDLEGGEEARTRYRTLRSNGRLAWLEVEPLTGRTHQIRAHLAAAGHPIAGDKCYPDAEPYRRYVREGLTPDLLALLRIPRLALHARELHFQHPRTRQAVRFVSETPAWLNRFYDEDS